jgi:hypothetical protein
LFIPSNAAGTEVVASMPAKTKSLLQSTPLSAACNTGPKEPSYMTTNANPAETVNGEIAPHHSEKPIWGAAAIAPIINRSRRQTWHLLSTGQIKCAVKKGGRFVAYPSKLRQEFGGG